MRIVDRARQAKYAREHYERNKASMKLRARKFTAKMAKRNRQFARKYLASHPCVDCGESDPVVLEFDHVRGTKVKDVSAMMKSHSIEVIRREIAKCEVRCANCHRRATAARRKLSRKPVVKADAMDMPLFSTSAKS